MSNKNSCVETPDAPDWLSKLEDRREKLKRSKLGHEAGAGAPCNECGEKCPGLDLHFWRKVCRNCKCRKDQHMCHDDEVSGWAQFEILGQIRSKPAFIKIKTLANQPVQVEWVPPNVAPDVAADYMEKLGSENVPIAGSKAAAKRKQQLEFQVPPHDLDAGFCDNLTDPEADQLHQYVQKIRENCVGQGNVVRVGNYESPRFVTVNEGDKQNKAELYDVMIALQESSLVDPILSNLLSNDKLTAAITERKPCEYPKIFVAFSEAISDCPLAVELESKLTPSTVKKLRGLNEAAVKSLVLNGPVYDKIFGLLKKNKLDISRDPRLGPLSDLRMEYLLNPFARAEIETIFNISSPNTSTSTYSSPLKTPLRNVGDVAFNSPLPLKSQANFRSGSQVLQDTPMRKIKFGNTSTIVNECNLPVNVDYERDPIFAKIIFSEQLANAVKCAKSMNKPQLIIMSPITIESLDTLADCTLSASTKQRLQFLGIKSNDMLQSAVLNSPFYERLLANLRERNIDYNQCQVLKPLERLEYELRTNRPLYEEVREYITSIPNSLAIAYSPLNMGLQQILNISKSSDSGFDSKPSTPNHSLASQTCITDEIKALSGNLKSIPGIEEMNMYPTVEVSKNMSKLSLHDHQEPQHSEHLQTSNVNCRDCSKAIEFGEVAVKAERAGKEIAWHPKCFKCHTCRELLADLVYFFHGGQVYCGRDLAMKLKIPRCKACDELIFTKEYTAAEGSTYHIKHFCCYHCDIPLAGQQYIPDENSNMPLCLKCYEEFFAVACQRCTQPIGPSDLGVAWTDIHWHDSCFLCAGKECGKSLIGGRFCVKQNMPFCSSTCVHSIMK